MPEHPISDLLKISMSNIKDIIDVDTVVGKAVEVNEKVTIIPISKVKCTFATGGTDQKSAKTTDGALPFGGATGGNVTITPVAFLVISDEVRLMHLDESVHLYERILDQVPDALNYLKDIFKKQPTVSDIEVIKKK